MGGHAAGEQASALAVETLDACFASLGQEPAQPDSSNDVSESLREAVEAANAAIMQRAEAEPALDGMGTTVVLALLQDLMLHVINVGDSRAYLIRGVSVQQLSRDHSMAAVLAEQGRISPEEARSHHLRNHLTSCLGSRRELEAAVTSIQLQPGDRIILCSDGLWDMLTDDQLGLISADCYRPSQLVWELIKAANEAGGRDNITVVALDIRSDSSTANRPPLAVEAVAAQD
jgi:protein phosphatase